MKNRLRQFFTDNRGAVAILTVLALIPILLAIGGAVDYARIMALRTRFQQATDSAALAALASINSDQALKQKFTSLGDFATAETASLIPGVDYQAVATNYIEQNFNSDKNFNVSTTSSVDWTKGTMTVTSKTSAQTYLLGLAGITSIDLTASATAAVGTGGQSQEIAIAFDTTASMNFKGRKQAAIKAAKDFIAGVMNYPTGAPNPYVSVSLVPFNDYVNVGPKSFWERPVVNTIPIGLTWLTSTDDIVQKFPEVCWEAKTETNRTEKTICTNYSATCTENRCTTVPATCTTDGESYECTRQDCTPVSVACTKQNCTGTGEFTTTTTNTPAGCTPAYEIRTVWNGCVGSRDNISDEIDLADSNNKVPAVFSVACPNLPIIYLSHNISYPFEQDSTNYLNINKNAQIKLTQSLDRINFDGTTYIAPGLLWAWRALSPEKPVAGWYDRGSDMVENINDMSEEERKLSTICDQEFSTGSFANRAATWGLQGFWRFYSEFNNPGCPYQYTKKSIVLMTDGYNTKSASYDDMGRHEKTDRTASNVKLARICSNIKAKGIAIYTIAFMVNDSDTLALLTSCSSGASYNYTAANASELSNAFQNIGSNFTRLRLIK